MTIKDYNGDKITSPEIVNKILKSILAMEEPFDRDKEHFWTIGVNQGNKVIFIELVSLGILNASLVHPREIFRMAILHGVAGIILAHNHPSGETTPSKEDIATTKQMVEAGKLLAIPVLDHVIHGNESYYSFASEGLIN